MIDLVILEGKYSICQFDIDQVIPSSIFLSDFYSITRTSDEISVIVREPLTFKPAKLSNGWRGFKVDSILDFSLTGIIIDITQPLKENGISVFVTSTYNTDYIFIKEESFDRTIEIFKSAVNINLKYR
ncbi:MAG: ACT domain-containing protein [Bacteroidetes bacterium]|nr:MAG: ACT domain-containing protein [Bacteroidota bacterium]